MHRVAAQQADPLDQVVGRAALAHHDGAQAQAVAAVGLLDQQPGHQAADTAETVQHHVLGLLQRPVLAANEVGQLLFHVLLQALAGGHPLLLVAHRQAADVDVGGAQVQVHQVGENGIGLKLGQFVALDLAHIAVILHDLQHRAIHQRLAVDVALDAFLARQASHQGNHALGEGLPLFPVLEVVVGAWALAIFGHVGVPQAGRGSGRVLSS